VGSATLSISTEGELAVSFDTPTAGGADARSGGEQLSSNAVSEIPLNKRDFSQLLLLAAGTATDTNGGANYTEQFAINGQRGVEATFALDGADSSDPELGGATFNLCRPAELRLPDHAFAVAPHLHHLRSGYVSRR
jgi:hypothetical protein